MTTKTCKYCFEIFERKHYGCVCSQCEKPKRSKMAESEICLVALDRISEPGRRAKIEDALRKYRSREDAIAIQAKNFDPISRLERTANVDDLGQAKYVRKRVGWRCKRCLSLQVKPRCLRCDLKGGEVE